MDLLFRIKEILISPINDPSMLWEILPLIITIIILEMYFGKFKTEELGWNSALSNSLVLIYIGTNLLHYLYLERLFNLNNAETIVSLGVAFMGIIIAFLDFHHLLPKRFAFGISSTLPVNYLAYLSIIFVHGFLILDKTSIIASIILFISLLIIVKIAQLFERPIMN